MTIWDLMRDDGDYPYKVEFWRACYSFSEGLALHGDMIDWLAMRGLVQNRDYRRGPMHRDGRTDMGHFMFIFRDKQEAAVFKLLWS